MVQFNFMLDIDFLMSNIKPEMKQKIPVLIVHGLKETAEQLQVKIDKEYKTCYSLWRVSKRYRRENGLMYH